MTKFTKKGAALVGGLVMLTGLVATQEAQAVPAFARQTGMACLSCHFQSFPALNSFGRAFKSGGYTMGGAQTNIEGDNISLPSTLNTSLITKIRYQKKNSEKRGELQWPDEAALLVGGRASEKIGFLSELSLMGHEVSTDADGVMSTPSYGAFTGFKLHGNVTDNVAVVLFGTDALGAAYGFETLNAGMQRSQRPIEGRDGMSAAQIMRLDGTATGVAVVYHTDEFFVNYSHTAPTYSNVNANLFGGLGHYIRAAYTPYIGGWETGFGVANWSGTIETGATTTDKTHMAATVFDAQAQGNLTDDVTLGVYASTGKAPKSTATKTNVYNPSTTDDETASAVLAKFGVGNWRPYVAYATSKIAGTKQNVTTLGTQYAVAQNINLDAFYFNSDIASKRYAMLSLFAAF